MEIEAAVFRKVLEPLTIEAVDIDKPWAREVLVRTVATGVCHSDLHVVDGQGRFPLDRPIVLGHEGAGIVEAVGAEVTTVKPGDHVVACLSGFCGSCPQCLSGHPNLCTGGIVTRPDEAAPRLSQNGPARCASSSAFRAMPKRCCCTRTRSCGSTPICRSTRRRSSAAAC